MNHGMPERRSRERVAVGLEGGFASDTGNPVACTVRDLSETGVRLVIPSPADVLLEFDLTIPHEGVVTRVRSVWTTGSHYGVKI